MLGRSIYSFCKDHDKYHILLKKRNGVLLLFAVYRDEVVAYRAPWEVDFSPVSNHKFGD